MSLSRSAENILLAFNTLGANEVVDLKSVKEHFAPLLLSTLETEVRKHNFRELLINRAEFCQNVIYNVSPHLCGYELYDMTIDALDPTPISELEPNNSEDVKAIALIQQHEAWMTLKTQQMEEEKDKAIAKREADIERALNELKQQIQDACVK